MLFDILQTVILCAALMGAFLLGVAVYRAGFADGRGKDVIQKPIVHLPKKAKTAENTPYYDDIMANINAYDGTETGQKEVRRK